MRSVISGTLLALIALTGCDNKPAAPTPVVLDTRLLDIYDRTCAACHANNPESGAPQAHDVAAWKPRLSFGDETLLDHSIQGFNGMPPLGQCVECNADDLMQLIHFMAAPLASKEK